MPANSAAAMAICSSTPSMFWTISEFQYRRTLIPRAASQASRRWSRSVSSGRLCCPPSSSSRGEGAGNRNQARKDRRSVGGESGGHRFDRCAIGTRDAAPRRLNSDAAHELFAFSVAFDRSATRKTPTRSPPPLAPATDLPLSGEGGPAARLLEVSTPKEAAVLGYHRRSSVQGNHTCFATHQGRLQRHQARELPSPS